MLGEWWEYSYLTFNMKNAFMLLVFFQLNANTQGVFGSAFFYFCCDKKREAKPNGSIVSIDCRQKQLSS